MSKAKKITEEDGIHKQWYEEAKKVTPETIGEFVRHLTEDYAHDYGTICHACAAAAVAACHAVDHSPQGGITGFQAGAIMWEFIEAWNATENGPKRLVCYQNMLYPQYEDKFQKMITPSTWKYLQEEAQKKIHEASASPVHEDVLAHWKSITAGKIPFGYKEQS